MCKKMASFFLATMLLTTPVFAQTTNNAEPVSNYKNGIHYLDNVPVYSQEDIESGRVHNDLMNGKLEENSVRQKRSITYDKWLLKSTSDIYSGQCSSFHNNTTKHTIKLDFTTTSQTNAKINGEVSFGFKKIAEAKIGVSIGHTWGKEITVNLEVSPYSRATYKTACKVPLYNYVYHHREHFWDHDDDYTTYSASAYGYSGIEDWFWENPLKKKS